MNVKKCGFLIKSRRRKEKLKQRKVGNVALLVRNKSVQGPNSTKEGGRFSGGGKPGLKTISTGTVKNLS